MKKGSDDGGGSTKSKVQSLSRRHGASSSVAPDLPESDDLHRQIEVLRAMVINGGGRSKIHESRFEGRRDAKPPIFNGEADWKPFYLQFGMVADRCILDKQERCLRLGEAMKGEALE